MKKVFTLFVLLMLVLMSAQAQIALKLHVETAGTLPSLIAESEKYQITDLTLSGNLNGTDIRYIREMTVNNFEDYEIKGKLTVLNLAEANIVSGGDYYYNNKDFSVLYYTCNNTVSKHMFKAGLISIIIPNSITSIGDMAFFDYSNLTSITIPNSVTSIENSAFYGCSGLTEIHSNNPVPPILGTNVFHGVSTSAILHVPKSSSSRYLLAPSWGRFFNIIEEDLSSINENEENALKVYSEANAIIIQNAEVGETIAVYSQSGILIKTIKATDSTSRIELSDKGIYIVRVANQSFKVILHG